MIVIENYFKYLTHIMRLLFLFLILNLFWKRKDWLRTAFRCVELLFKLGCILARWNSDKCRDASPDLIQKINIKTWRPPSSIIYRLRCYIFIYLFCRIKMREADRSDSTKTDDPKKDVWKASSQKRYAKGKVFFVDSDMY